jgi:hypothetical protein
MIADDQLRQWLDFLDSQSARFGKEIVAFGGNPLRDTEENVAFISVDDELLRDRIASLVKEFILTSEWGAATEKEWVHLKHRTGTARNILVVLLSRQGRPEQVRPPLPDSTDRSRFIHWLFIDHWEVVGRAYMKAYTAAWMSMRLETTK